MENNDQDTLQLEDELDSEWVKLWHNAIKKKPKLRVDCIPAETVILQKSYRQSKKTQ